MVSELHISTADIIRLGTLCGYVNNHYQPGSLPALTPIVIRLMLVCSLSDFNNIIHMHTLNRHAVDSDLKELNARGGCHREKMFKAGT